MNRTRFALAVTVALLLLGAGGGQARLQPGQVLDQSTWQEAKDLYPDEILEHYRKGEFASPIGDMKVPYALDESALAAAEENEGRFKIDERGSLVEAATGKIPEYNFGLPFAKLDPKDPQIAYKIVWNYEYAYWSNGSNQMNAHMIWLSGGSNAVERRVMIETMAKVIEGNRRQEPNPLQLSRLDRTFMLEPADVYGTATLGWRFKDSEKRDNMWAYVPALRRVRAVSPANRSDGVLGSEMTQDDGFNGFDGKPEDFKFELAGSGEQYTSFSPESLAGTVEFLPGLTGQGWHFETPQSGYGFNTPGWKGAAWALLTNHLVARPVWVIDAIPTDKYYVYGKIRIFVDRETYKVSNVVKYNWKGESVAVFTRALAYGKAPDGYRYVNLAGGGHGGSYGENLKTNRATVGDPSSEKGATNELDANLPMDSFQQEKLVQVGR